MRKARQLVILKMRRNTREDQSINTCAFRHWRDGFHWLSENQSVGFRSFKWGFDVFICTVRRTRQSVDRHQHIHWSSVGTTDVSSFDQRISFDAIRPRSVSIQIVLVSIGMISLSRICREPMQKTRVTTHERSWVDLKTTSEWIRRTTLGQATLRPMLNSAIEEISKIVLALQSTLYSEQVIRCVWFARRIGFDREKSFPLAGRMKKELDFWRRKLG